MSVRSTLTRASVLIAAGLAAALTLSACGVVRSAGHLVDRVGRRLRLRAPPAPSRRPAVPIVIGSANFPESALIANIYAAALKAKGVDASTNLNIGSREIYLKALQDGSIDLVPEYSGVLLQYFDPTATAVSSDDVYTALVAKTPSGLKVLTKSAAEDKDAVVVTKETADANNLKSIADLAPVASTFVLGGPPEWATRPTGVPGLKEKYGLTFKEFKALDAGGPLTLGALTSDQIQAGNLFTTDPAIPANDLVVLEDPKNLFAAQNVLPLINAAKSNPQVRSGAGRGVGQAGHRDAHRAADQGAGRQGGLRRRSRRSGWPRTCSSSRAVCATARCERAGPLGPARSAAETPAPVPPATYLRWQPGRVPGATLCPCPPPRPRRSPRLVSAKVRHTLHPYHHDPATTAFGDEVVTALGLGPGAGVQDAGGLRRRRARPSASSRSRPSWT